MGRQRLSSSHADLSSCYLSPHQLWSETVYGFGTSSQRLWCQLPWTHGKTGRRPVRKCLLLPSNIGRIITSSVTRQQNSLVHAFVTTRPDNGNPLLLGITKTQISGLQRVQNMTARIVTRTRRREHVTPVLCSLHWLPVSYRIPYKILLLTFKSMNELFPLTGLLKSFPPARQLRSTVQHLFTVPTTRYSTVGAWAFQNAAPKRALWNDLPVTARAYSSLAAVKRHLKTVLFAHVF